MCHLYASLPLFTHIHTCFYAFHWVTVNLDCWWSKGVQSSCMLLKRKEGRLNTIAPLRTLFIFGFSLAFCCSASCRHSKASCSCSRSRAENILKNILGATLLRSSVLSHSLNLHRHSIQRQTFDVSFSSICGPNTCKKFQKVKVQEEFDFKVCIYTFEDGIFPRWCIVLCACFKGWEPLNVLFSFVQFKT